MKIRSTTPAAVAAAALLAATLPLAVAGSAQAGGSDGRVINTGSCSGSTDWKMKAKPDDGRIEVEAEIDSNRTGQSWTWVLRHDGGVTARGTSVTRGRSGSFSVERRTVDADGTDQFTFRAVNPATDEVCVATVAL
ncbi:hypothetical protein [Nocardioides sp.]|uniref:hypothetical protein n=1 Tax=Nocardioides sp. TaxID=35761 RepID=UPI00286B506A|nr:hypothetical protein [Nocardioides sp.]